MQACVGLGGRLGWVSESFVSALIPQMFIEHLLRVYQALLAREDASVNTEEFCPRGAHALNQ